MVFRVGNTRICLHYVSQVVQMSRLKYYMEMHLSFRPLYKLRKNLNQDSSFMFKYTNKVYFIIIRDIKHINNRLILAYRSILFI